MKECPLGFECIKSLDCYCINSEYCLELSYPLNLPYNYKFDDYLNCSILTVGGGFGWRDYPENTLKDLEESGWALPEDLFYTRAFDPVDKCWFLKVNLITQDVRGWSLAEDLPYTYIWEESLNKFCISVNWTRRDDFQKAVTLPYKIYKNEWGCNVLEVTDFISVYEGGGWCYSQKGLAFETTFVKNGYRIFPCHTVVVNRDGFARSESLPYRRSKKALTVTKNIPEYGYQKAISIEPNKYQGLICYKTNNYFCIPENLKSKTALKKMGLELHDGQKTKAYYGNRYDIYPLYDLNDCIKITKKCRSKKKEL